MNKEPTPEQIKEFWEWCGFRVGQIGSAVTWYSPTGAIIFGYPPRDLNNLFKYAVPIARKTIKKACNPPRNSGRHSYDTRHWTRCLFDKWLDEVLIRGKDPAIALFWALWAVMKEATDANKTG